MTSNALKPDVNEMFLKMGEKLGWFKQQSFSHSTSKQTVSKSVKKNGQSSSGDFCMEDSNHTTGTSRKLKPKRKKKDHEKQPDETEEKHEIPLRRTPANTNLAFSLQSLLSSDSDEELDCPKAADKAKPLTQICVNSDDDRPSQKDCKRTSVSCVEESVLSADCVEHDLVCSDQVLKDSGISGGAVLNEEQGHHSVASYSDTVVKGRVSLLSCTLDLENLGEPLVESTRIHRRSSVSYKQILDIVDDSDEEKDGNIQQNEETHLKVGNDILAQEILDTELSVCNETHYVTAIETVEETLNNDIVNSDNTNMKTVGSEASFKTGNTDYKEEVQKRSYHDMHDMKITSVEESSADSSAESGEEIEVTDAATQTDNAEFVDVVYSEVVGSNQSVLAERVHRVYAEATVTDDSSGNKVFESHINAYMQETVEESLVRITKLHCSDDGSLERVREICDTVGHKLDESNTEQESESKVKEESRKDIDDLASKLASATIENSDIDEFSARTVALDSRSVYSNATDSSKQISGCVEETGGFSNMASKTDADNDTLEVSAPQEVEEADNKQVADEHSESSDTEESFVEVKDVQTQTDDVSVMENDKIAGVEDTENSIIDRSAQGKEDSSTTGKTNLYISDSGSEDAEESFSRCKEEEVVRETEEISKRKPGQSWRSSRRYSSDSSGDDELEAFFQKLREPEKKKSEEASPVSLNEFIVDDDDMTSESDDCSFYLRENQDLDKRQDVGSDDESDGEREKEDDDDDDVFSSKVYPGSVTKHKKKFAKGRWSRNISWSFSSDSDSDLESKDRASKLNSNNKVWTDSMDVPVQQKESSKNSAQKKTSQDISKPRNTRSENSCKNIQSRLEVSLLSDSDNDDLDAVLFQLEGIGVQKQKEKSSKLEESDGYNELNATDFGKKPESFGNRVNTRENEEVLFKTPNLIRKKTVSRGSDKENEFKTPTPLKKKTTETPKCVMYISLSDEDSEEDSSGFVVTPTTPSLDDNLPTPDSSSATYDKPSKTPKSLPKCRTPISVHRDQLLSETPLSGSSHYTYSFLKSLSASIEDSRRHPDARRFVNSFKKTKEELSQYLLNFYNTTVFDSKLPSDIPLIWNKRLLRTAGYCAYKKNANDDCDRTTRIELSTKVCDTAERVRDTLIHEMCHAAVWLLNGVNGGHGPYWKYWARQATKIHSELPTIDRCHSYSINTKYTYRCRKCGYSIGRHSKSLDTAKKVCGYCSGEFELIQNSVPSTPKSAVSSTSATPRSANKFAVFVKDNYNSVKKKNKDLKHGEVMKELSKLFAESKLSS